MEFKNRVVDFVQRLSSSGALRAALHGRPVACDSGRQVVCRRLANGSSALWVDPCVRRKTVAAAPASLATSLSAWLNFSHTTTTAKASNTAYSTPTVPNLKPATSLLV